MMKFTHSYVYIERVAAVSRWQTLGKLTASFFAAVACAIGEQPDTKTQKRCDSPPWESDLIKRTNCNTSLKYSKGDDIIIAAISTYFFSQNPAILSVAPHDELTNVRIIEE